MTPPCCRPFRAIPRPPHRPDRRRRREIDGQGPHQRRYAACRRQRRNRAELATQRDQANKVLAELKIVKAKVEGDKRVAEADLGPVRYLATLLGAGDQEVLRWFILVIAVLLDSSGGPAAAGGDAAVSDRGLLRHPKWRCSGAGLVRS